jgi:hypothetical protein
MEGQIALEDDVRLPGEPVKVVAVRGEHGDHGRELRLAHGRILRLLPQAKADAAGLASGAVLRRAGDGLLGSCLRELTLRLRRGGQRFSRLAARGGGGERQNQDCRQPGEVAPAAEKSRVSASGGGRRRALRAAHRAI